MMSQPKKDSGPKLLPVEDWLACQAKFQAAGRPKPRPKSTYQYHQRKGKSHAT
jgi:hypothetical protein